MADVECGLIVGVAVVDRREGALSVVEIDEAKSAVRDQAIRQLAVRRDVLGGTALERVTK